MRDTYMAPRTDFRPLDWSGQPVYVAPSSVIECPSCGAEDVEPHNVDGVDCCELCYTQHDWLWQYGDSE